VKLTIVRIKKGLFTKVKCEAAAHPDRCAVDPVTYVAPDYVVSGYVQYDRWAVDPVTYMMPDYVVSGYVS